MDELYQRFLKAQNNDIYFDGFIQKACVTFCEYMLGLADQECAFDQEETTFEAVSQRILRQSISLTPDFTHHFTPRLAAETDFIAVYAELINDFSGNIKSLGLKHFLIPDKLDSNYVYQRRGISKRSERITYTASIEDLILNLSTLRESVILYFDYRRLVNNCKVDL